MSHPERIDEDSVPISMILPSSIRMLSPLTDNGRCQIAGYNRSDIDNRGLHDARP
jgi:hypothetical protein